MSEKGLTPKQERFIEEYMVDMNGTQAAIRAGYSPHTANEQAAQLLAKLSIKAEVEQRLNRRSFKVELNAETVLNEIKRVALFDTRKLFDKTGRMLNPHEWDDDTAAVVSSVETEQLFEGRGEDREHIGYSKKVKLWDKLKGLDMAAKHLGLYEKDNAQRAPDLQLQIVVLGPEPERPAPLPVVKGGARITSR